MSSYANGKNKSATSPKSRNTVHRNNQRTHRFKGKNGSGRRYRSASNRKNKYGPKIEAVKRS